MAPRLEYAKLSPYGIKPLLDLETFVRASGLELALLELVRMRASQLNGCAYCLDMHSKDARAAGESEQRLHVLAAWREAPFYSVRERAALVWTEALTLIAEGQVSDRVYNETLAHFSEKEMVSLTLAIIAINSWNRLAIGFGTPPGTYQPAVGKPSAS